MAEDDTQKSGPTPVQGEQNKVQEARIEKGDLAKARIEVRPPEEPFAVRTIIGVDRDPLHGMDSTEPVTGEPIQASPVQSQDGSPGGSDSSGGGSSEAGS